MGAERLTALGSLEDSLGDQLRAEEDLGWHHLPSSDERFQTYLRTATWLQAVRKAIAAVRATREEYEDEEELDA